MTYGDKGCSRWKITQEFGRLKRDGMSVRAICRTFRHCHHTIKKALNNAEPQPYTRTKPTIAPVLGPFVHIIDRILLDDTSESTKQRRKASKIYRRVRDEHGYGCSYDQVRRYVKRHRKQHRETFIPQAHEPDCCYRSLLIVMKESSCWSPATLHLAIGAGLPGRTHDGGPAGSVGVSLSYLRDER